jgi:molecular chaperone GrpE
MKQARNGDPGSPRATDRSRKRALTDLAAEMAAVRNLMATLDDHVAARERIIEQLSQNLEQPGSGDPHTLVRPFLTDLQRLRDDLLRQVGALTGEATTAQVAALLESFAYSVERTLARGGIDILRPEVGSPVDPRRHRVTGIVPTTRAELDGTVAEVVSDGYLDTTTDRMLASATVHAYRCAVIADAAAI